MTGPVFGSVVCVVGQNGRAALSGPASRIPLGAAGLLPDVYGRTLPVERAILSAAAAFGATLLVLPLGDTEEARDRAISIARLAASIRAAG